MVHYQTGVDQMISNKAKQLIDNYGDAVYSQGMDAYSYSEWYSKEVSEKAQKELEDFVLMLEQTIKNAGITFGQSD